METDKIIFEVEEVFRELDQHIAQTALISGIQCPQFCGACCRKTDIEATVLEFIPFAASLYQTNKVDKFLTHLDQCNENSFCALFSSEAWKEGKWGCQYYSKRGLICRLFGFAYRLNRKELPELVTCKILKGKYPEEIIQLQKFGTDHPEDIPLFRNYSMKLYAIEPELALKLLPINQAIRLAIEKLYFQFQPGIEKDPDE